MSSKITNKEVLRQFDEKNQETVDQVNEMIKEAISKVEGISAFMDRQVKSLYADIDYKYKDNLGILTNHLQKLNQTIQSITSQGTMNSLYFAAIAELLYKKKIITREELTSAVKEESERQIEANKEAIKKSEQKDKK